MQIDNTTQCDNETQRNLFFFPFKLIDTPGPVQALEASDITMVSCNLSWSPPENDGGSEITHYIVEKREVDRKTWATVNNDVKKTNLKITNLISGTEYYFRVTAVNEYGAGVPKISPKSYLASNPISKCIDADMLGTGVGGNELQSHVLP